MKKILSVILVAVMLLSVGGAAFADDDVTVTYALRCDGKDDIVVNTGDVITVAYLLSASKEAVLSVTQNEIYYDTAYLELVEGSNVQSAGYEDYITTVQQRLNTNHYVFFNTITTYTHNTEPVEIGTMQFKVIGTEGETTVSCTNCLSTDLDANEYKSKTSDLHISIGSKQAQKFTVIFMNEGGVEFQRVEVDGGKTVTLPEGPEKMYYDFTGWTISGDPAKHAPGEKYKPTSDVTFLPNWALKSGQPSEAPGQPVEKETHGGLFLIIGLLLLLIILVIVYIINKQKQQKKKRSKHRR